MSVERTYCTIHWIVIYPVDSVIYPLINNRDLLIVDAREPVCAKRKLSTKSFCLDALKNSPYKFFRADL